MPRPRVSVAMVVCNVDRFLAEAIESVLNQSLRDLEFVIVDFGSNDRTKTIVSEYAAKDSRINFREIPHCGLAEARNVACFLSSGDYIAIMDADDVAVEKRLEWQVEFMMKSPAVGVVGGGVQWIDAQGTPLRTVYNPCENSEIQESLWTICPFWQPTVLMRRDAFRSVGGYREVFAPAEDYDLWLRIAEHYEMANLPRVLLNYRMHSGQVSVRKRQKQTFGFIAARASASQRRQGKSDPMNSITEITPASLQEIGIDNSTIEMTLSCEYIRWIRHLFLAKEYSTALEVCSQALKLSNWTYAKKTIVDVQLISAQIHWKKRNFLLSLKCVANAFVRRPLIAGRPFRALIRGLQSQPDNSI